MWLFYVEDLLSLKDFISVIRIYLGSCPKILDWEFSGYHVFVLQDSPGLGLPCGPRWWTRCRQSQVHEAVSNVSITTVSVLTELHNATGK